MLERYTAYRRGLYMQRPWPLPPLLPLLSRMPLLCGQRWRRVEPDDVDKHGPETWATRHGPQTLLSDGTSSMLEEGRAALHAGWEVHEGGRESNVCGGRERGGGGGGAHEAGALQVRVGA